MSNAEDDDTTSRIRAGVMRHIAGANRVATRRAVKADVRGRQGAVVRQKRPPREPAAVADAVSYATPVAPAVDEKRRMPRVTDGMISAAKRMKPAKRTRQEQANTQSVFNIYQPPPGVLPSGKSAKIAMDEAMGSTSAFSLVQSWGLDGLGSIGAMFEEGIGFLGYSYLALLTQRPEYRKISERTATEMTREWIELQATDSDDEAAQPEEGEDDGEEVEADEAVGAEPDAASARKKGAVPAKNAGGKNSKRSAQVASDEDLAAAIAAAIEGGGEDDLAGKDDKTEKIKELEDELQRHKIRDLFRNIAEYDGWFGRSHIYCDIDDVAMKARDLETGASEIKTPIGNGRDAASRAKVQKGTKLQFKNVEAMWCYPATYEAVNPLLQGWYRPETWYCNGIEVHRSRLLTFIGREVPDILKPAYAFGGLSMSQMAKPYVDNWLRTRQAVADLIESFSVSGIYSNLAGWLEDGGDGMAKRVDLFNQTRSNAGAFLLDKDTEEFFNVSTPLGTLDALQAQSQEQMSSVTGIPLVVLLGITPKGLNASSEGEIRVFYDWIKAYQESFFRDHLQTVIELVQLSIWGEIDDEITFAFKPLWSMTEKEKGEVDKHEAEADQIRIDSGVLDTAEVRKAVAAKPGSRYADINVADVPEPPADPMGEEGGDDPFGNGGGGEGNDDRDPEGGGSNPFSSSSEKGAQDEAIFEASLGADEWDEGKHPRAESGQFGAGGGGKTGKSASPSASAKPALKPSELSKQGGKLGSNAGGTYTDKSGAKFYIKKPASREHVANERAAARLYQLAGVNTLDYHDVEGGEHVATKWEKLDKNNIADMTPAERKDAAKDFMVHAWLSNWDAAGTGGDNQGMRGGKPVTLDVGGSLRFRAQGGPKGAAFGKNVSEIDTMRNSSMSPDAARLFGKMSDADLKSSAQRVTSIPDAKIRDAVNGDDELADTLIARKADIAKRYGIAQDQAGPRHHHDLTPADDDEFEPEEVAPDVFVAQDENHFDESKIKRDGDGKFSSTGGGSSSAKPAGSAAEVASAFKTKKEHIAHLLTNGITPKELMTTMGWPSVSMPAQAASLGMKLEKKDGKYFGTKMTDAELADAKKAAAEKKAGKETDAAAQAILKNAGLDKPAAAEPAPPVLPKTPETYAQFIGQVAELKKAQDEIAAKAKTEKERLEKKFKDDPEFAMHYEAMSDLMGGSHASEQFRKQAAVQLANSGLEKHLTPEAAMPIIAYSGSHYHVLNDQLRKGQMTMAQYKFAKSLNAGLDRLPAHTETTFRKAPSSSIDLSLYKPGMVVEERGFTSTSKVKGAWSGDVQYTVHGKSGRDISKISSHPGEAEVLFKSGTRFLVEKVDGKNITLREV